MTTANRMRRDPLVPLTREYLEELTLVQPLDRLNDGARIVRELALEVIALRGELEATTAAVTHVATRIRDDGNIRWLAGRASQTLTLVASAMAATSSRDAPEWEDELVGRPPRNERHLFSVGELIRGLARVAPELRSAKLERAIEGVAAVIVHGQPEEGEEDGEVTP